MILLIFKKYIKYIMLFLILLFILQLQTIELNNNAKNVKSLVSTQQITDSTVSNLLPSQSQIKEKTEEYIELKYHSEFYYDDYNMINYYNECIPLSFELQTIIYNLSEEYNIDYYIIIGLIQTESNFNSEAKNKYSGCYGLLQLHPLYFPKNLSPKDNVIYGITTLANKIDKYNGDIEAALTAYSVGYDDGSRYYANKVLENAKNWK